MAVALGAANAWVWRASHANRAATPQENSSGQSEVGAARPTGQKRAPQQAESSEQKKTMAEAASRVSPQAWTKVETDDYKQYAGNLRAIGFPEELVREIVIADVNKAYEAREAPLRRRLAPHDAPTSERLGPFSEEEFQRIQQLRALEKERQSVLEQILGVYVPREFARAPHSRNYEAYEYAISLMPESKREAVQTIQEDMLITEDLNKLKIPVGSREELEDYKRGVEQRNAALRNILTPEEYALFERNTAVPATELARNVAGMEPTDSEFAAMAEVYTQYWTNTGGVYGRWRAEEVSAEQIAAAEEQMRQSFKQVLGADRYRDYEMAASQSGQQLRNLGARYDLPRDTIYQAFQLQQQMEQLARKPTDASSSGPDDLNAQLRQVLGPATYAAWMDGKDRRPNLNP